MKPSFYSTTLVVATIAQAALAITFNNSHSPSTIAPSPLPPPGSSSQAEEIIRQFASLRRSTKWKLVSKITFEGTTGEPEGLARVGPDRYYVGSGEWLTPTVKYPSPINGTDRTTGSGFAHILVFDGSGRQVADATISAPGDTEYHIGGIEYDGAHIWATLSEYRPNSTATVVRIDPSTLDPEPVFRVRDHQGGIVHDLVTDDLVTLNWGAREASLWNLGYKLKPLPEFSRPRSVTSNPSNWIDYQDCKFLGHSKKYDSRAVMICSGIADIGGGDGQQEAFRLGGVAIVDMLSMVPLADVPIPMISDRGQAMAKNPFDVAIVDGKLRFYFLPDEGESTLYVYEAE
ncbi:uncharacterized protein DNG_09188 [Cephalotrichum gorgonifer]|uniref:Uncharacterized protein n=1 Tax=Cephalotrichum gorgonifer TaxID=2041049 RepID=A0AAE8N734_9PEZI|nr:uncharacterized protein DNG_09188 [Cephalotrichum gorgonifer]